MRVSEALSAGLTRADAEILLASLLRKPRTWVMAHGDETLSAVQEAAWREWVTRRAGGEPVAYILGEKEFFGRPFQVSKDVLVPRPATEHLVQATLAFLKHPQSATIQADDGIAIVVRPLKPLPPTTIVDIGTGSGCIAITLGLETPLHVIATDISELALRVARDNAAALGADRIEWKIGEALEPIKDLEEPFLLVSNPPYIPDGEELMRDVAEHEPREALFGGTDGADIIRTIVTQATQHPRCMGVILECRNDQVSIIDAILAL